MHYTYVLRINGNNMYIGSTNDLRRRMVEHQKEKNCELIYYEAYGTEYMARIREKRLKYHGSAWRGLKKRIIA